MKKFNHFLISLFLLPIWAAQAQSDNGPIAISGNNISLNAPNAAQSGVALIAPYTDSTAKVQISTGQTVRSVIDGAGSKFYPVSNPADGTAATTITNSATIDSTVFWQRVTQAGAVTGIIIEAGTAHGQQVFVSVDKDAGGSATMAAEATSNVCSGTGSVIAAGEGALYIWDATDTCWSEFGT